MSDWVSTVLIITALLNAVAAVLAWVAKLKWSREYAAAKDETIKAKEAQMETLRLQLEELKAMTPMKVREYYLSVKEQLEEYNDSLHNKLDTAQDEITVLQRQIEEEQERKAEYRSQYLDQLEKRYTALKEFSKNLQEEMDEVKTTSEQVNSAANLAGSETLRCRIESYLSSIYKANNLTFAERRFQRNSVDSETTNNE